MNHRMGNRLRANHTVSLLIPGVGEIEGQLRNISLSGAAVTTPDIHRIEPYMPLSLKVHFPGSSRPDPVGVEGFVVRLQDDLIGIMFMRERIELVNDLRPNNRSENEALDTSF